MKAGFAKNKLSIKEKLKLSGFNDDRLSANQLDGIFGKAIIIEEKKNKFVFLVLDLLFVGKKLSEKIKEKINYLYNIPKDQILISSTHTHSAPKTCEQFLDNSRINEAFFKEVLKKSINVIKQAIERSSLIKVELYEINNFPAINRRLPIPWLLKLHPSYLNKGCLNRPNRSANTDKSCRAIKFISKNKSFFWIINAAAHATNYNGNNISSDYPYYIEKNLIKYSKNNLCKGSLFLQGWAGNQNCDLTRKLKNSFYPTSMLEKKFIKETFNKSASKKNLNFLGKKIAKSILQAKIKEKINFKNLYTKTESIALTLKNKEKINLNLQMFSLGNIKIFGLNGEIFASYRENLLKILKNKPSYYIFTVGYTDYPAGYIPDTKALQIGGYETDRSIKYFGLSSRFSNSVENRINLGFKKILKKK